MATGSFGGGVAVTTFSVGGLASRGIAYGTARQLLDILGAAAHDIDKTEPAGSDASDDAKTGADPVLAPGPQPAKTTEQS